MSTTNMEVIAGRVHDARMRLFRAGGIAELIADVACGYANGKPAEPRTLSSVWQSALELAQIVDAVAGDLEPNVVFADDE
ncbi:MAG: hypothetical protein AB7G76_06270 [Steroidobacteraceae bacterium]